MKGSSLIKRLVSILAVVLFLLKMQALTGCANIVPPEGGKRDTIPPRLIAANPPDSSVNIRPRRITLTFDEFVELQDVPNNLIVTPTFENNPVIESKLKTLTIRIKDSLESNTTYVFNFGNAIRDVNEGNVLKNFTYTFSTGHVMDTLTYRGRVLLAETGGVDTTLIVMLHRDLTDSAVSKKRPQYYTRLDHDGNFVLHNLPHGTFAIYALGNAGMMRRYTTKTQLFAFSNDSIITGSTPPITLYAYREEPPRIQGGAGVAAPAGAGPRAPVTERRLRYTTDVTTNPQDIQKDLLLTFQVPLRTFDSTKISLSRDSSFTPVAFSTALDTSRTQLAISTKWKDDTHYHLILDKTFAQDTTGKQLLKTDTLNFATRRLSEYGNLTMRIRNIDAAQNPVLQFVQNNQVVYATPVKSGRFSTSLFLPGEYEIRILYDRNGNGKWDPGHFFGQKRQPEIVRPFSRRITVKPNWGNEFDVSL